MNREENNRITGDREDANLVRSFQNGERDSFETLVIKYKDRVFNLCYRFMGDFHEAEDLSQDVFLKAYRALNRFRMESSFYTWLYRIAVNTCKNRINSSAFRFSGRNISVEHTEDNGILIAGDEKENPAEQLENKERAGHIQRAINTLPPEQKTMVILRDIEGLSYEEIQEITGEKLGTVKSRLSRARVDLTKKLKGVL